MKFINSLIFLPSCEMILKSEWSGMETSVLNRTNPLSPRYKLLEDICVLMMLYSFIYRHTLEVWLYLLTHTGHCQFIHQKKWKIIGIEIFMNWALTCKYNVKVLSFSFPPEMCCWQIYRDVSYECQENIFGGGGEILWNFYNTVDVDYYA